MDISKSSFTEFKELIEKHHSDIIYNILDIIRDTPNEQIKDLDNKLDYLFEAIQKIEF